MMRLLFLAAALQAEHKFLRQPQSDAQVAAGSFLCGDWNSIFCAVSSRSLDPSVSEQLWCGEASGGVAGFCGDLTAAARREAFSFGSQPPFETYFQSLFLIEPFQILSLEHESHSGFQSSFPSHATLTPPSGLLCVT